MQSNVLVTQSTLQLNMSNIPLHRDLYQWNATAHKSVYNTVDMLIQHIDRSLDFFYLSVIADAIFAGFSDSDGFTEPFSVQEKRDGQQKNEERRRNSLSRF